MWFKSKIALSILSVMGVGAVTTAVVVPTTLAVQQKDADAQFAYVVHNDVTSTSSNEVNIQFQVNEPDTIDHVTYTFDPQSGGADFDITITNTGWIDDESVSVNESSSNFIAGETYDVTASYQTTDGSDYVIETNGQTVTMMINESDVHWADTAMFDTKIDQATATLTIEGLGSTSPKDAFWVIDWTLYENGTEYVDDGSLLDPLVTWVNQGAGEWSTELTMEYLEPETDYSLEVYFKGKGPLLNPSIEETKTYNFTTQPKFQHATFDITEDDTQDTFTSAVLHFEHIDGYYYDDLYNEYGSLLDSAKVTNIHATDGSDTVSDVTFTGDVSDSFDVTINGLQTETTYDATVVFDFNDHLVDANQVSYDVTFDTLLRNNAPEFTIQGLTTKQTDNTANEHEISGQVRIDPGTGDSERGPGNHNNVESFDIVLSSNGSVVDTQTVNDPTSDVIDFSFSGLEANTLYEVSVTNIVVDETTEPAVDPIPETITTEKNHSFDTYWTLSNTAVTNNTATFEIAFVDEYNINLDDITYEVIKVEDSSVVDSGSLMANDEWQNFTIENLESNTEYEISVTVDPNEDTIEDPSTDTITVGFKTDYNPAPVPGDIYVENVTDNSANLIVEIDDNWEYATGINVTVEDEDGTSYNFSQTGNVESVNTIALTGLDEFTKYTVSVEILVDGTETYPVDPQPASIEFETSAKDIQFTGTTSSTLVEEGIYEVEYDVINTTGYVYQEFILTETETGNETIYTTNNPLSSGTEIKIIEIPDTTKTYTLTINIFAKQFPSDLEPTVTDQIVININ